MDGMTVDLLDHAPCGFVSFGDDGKIGYVNATLVDRLGFTRESLEGRHIETIFGVGTKLFYQTHFFPLVKLHGRAQEVFMLLRDKEGVDVGMLCNAVRRRAGDSELTDCVFVEVQERRKFEEALLQARRDAEQSAAQLEQQAVELEMQSEALHNANDELHRLNEDLEKQRRAADEANHAKSNFLAVMSHELRTPLNAIGGYVQLLDMGVHGPVSDAQRDALGRIDRSQRHLLRLINDVLNLSRIEAGRVDYVVERVSLAAVVNSVLPMIEPQAESKHLTLESAIPRNLFASADREKAQQILLNLLTNAIKFTADGGSICVEAGVADEKRIYLRVIDTGVGIPREMLEKVFEPFVQVDASHSRSAEGTGLGLAISRDLARGMGGDLSAQSAPGSGSAFELTLRRLHD
jgi:PAS domain S-box-containing protein